MAAPPRLEVLCTHRGASGRAHAAELESTLAALAAQGRCRQPGGAGPLVVVHCGDERGRRAARRRAERHADGSAELVHVRLDTQGERTQARRLVLGALRFAAVAGDARPPRRGPLAALRREAAVSLVEERCAGAVRCGLCASSCARRAIQAGAAGLPVVRASACDLCGECVRDCPRGAWGWGWAPWSALLARLEELLAAPRPGEAAVALLASERALPPGPEEVRETVQPAAEWILPLELPGGTLGAAVLLRALELGAARVCAVLPRGSAALPEVEAVACVARAAGASDTVRVARSMDEGVALLGESRPTVAPRPAPVATEPGLRPAAWPIAERLWRAGAAEPVSFGGEGAFASTVEADARRCTLCDLCTQSCPGGALALRRDAGAVALVLDAARCAGGCGLCARACPYGALAVRDEVRLPAQEAVLVAARLEACPRCGERWRGAPAVPALEARYAGDHGALRSFLAQCPSCRRSDLAASLRSPAPRGPEPERSEARAP